MRTNSLEKSLKNSRGMTLVEILIVLAILGSLIAILLPKITGSVDKSNVSKTKIIMGQIIQALNTYYIDCQKFPESLSSLTTADASCGNWGPEPYMKTVPKDGWNKEFEYTVEGSTFILKSLAKDGREGGDGFAKDISSEDLNQ